jgi:hypothetical protein
VIDINTAAKGYLQCRKFDLIAKEKGWLKVHGEHRYRTGPFFRTCSIFGFDRLYMSPEGPILVEVTDDANRSSHRKAIVDRIGLNPLLPKNFKIALVIYYGGHKKLDKRTDQKTWTKSGTWDVEWF